jgi:hypothetical protein
MTNVTRLDHFIRGNGLRLADIAEWSVIEERRLRRMLASADDMRVHDLYRLAGACSYLLGRRVRMTELIEV